MSFTACNVNVMIRKRKKDYHELRMHIWKIIYHQERFDSILETIILIDF